MTAKRDRAGPRRRLEADRAMLRSPTVWTAILSGLVVLATLASIALAWWRLTRRAAPFLTDTRSHPVTIVRPLSGIERFGAETLRSGFLLDHPDYELILCVASSADPVIPLVRRIMAEFPGFPCRLLVGDDRVSDNPKLNNCVKGWEAARYEWVVLADSNVLMPVDYLDRLLSAWRPTSGLVCSTPAGTRPDGFWAEVECAFLNTLQARWQYAGEAVGVGFAQGKSMLWRRPFLESRGGIRALAAEIAEDAASTKIVREAGLRVHVVDRPFDQPLGVRRPGEVWRRQLRWARLRRVSFPGFFAPEILSGPLLPLVGLALAAGSGTLAPVAAGGTFLAWYGAEIALARRVGWHLSWRLPLAFVLRDLMLPALWLSAYAVRNVVWHGTAMHISAEPAKALSPEPSRA